MKYRVFKKRIHRFVAEFAKTKISKAFKNSRDRKEWVREIQGEESMVVETAEALIKWGNGETASLGKLEISTTGKALRFEKKPLFKQRMGWELIKAGFRCMLPERKKDGESED